MVRTRYTDWDGSHRVRLNPEGVFRKLSEYLSFTDNVQQAFDWLLRHGAEWDGVRVSGVDDLLAEVRDLIHQRQQEVHLSRAFDLPLRRLEDLVEREKGVLGRREPAESAAPTALLESMTGPLSSLLARLREFPFEDASARQDFADLLDEADDIRALEDFVRRFGSVFRGPRPVDYPEALALMRELEQLQQLEEQLMSGDLASVDPESLRELLGIQSFQSLEELREMMTVLQQAGYVVPRGHHLQLSAKGIRQLGQLALRDIYQGLLRDRPGSHRTDHRGVANLRPEATKPYVFGEPLHLDIVATLKNAVARGTGTPLRLAPGDFEVHATDFSTTTSTVLLLDMSWSMSAEGRFAAAKKVALALDVLIRSRFPRDYFGIVGFYTRAVELKVGDLPEASWNMGDPFTNLQDGLRLAARLLDRHRSTNQHIILITDGQPTAYFSGGRLYCEWPMSFGGISPRAARETLREVERVTRKGITINTFMLDDSPGLLAFVEKMTRINRGRALYTQPNHLGEYLLVDYLGKKRKRG